MRYITFFFNIAKKIHLKRVQKWRKFFSKRVRVGSRNFYSFKTFKFLWYLCSVVVYCYYLIYMYCTMEQMVYVLGLYCSFFVSDFKQCRGLVLFVVGEVDFVEMLYRREMLLVYSHYN